MYQSFIGFSGFSKKLGTLGGVSLLSVPEFYRFLWIFEIIWYTWENEIPGVPEGYRVLWFFEIILGE